MGTYFRDLKGSRLWNHFDGYQGRNVFDYPDFDLGNPGFGFDNPDFDLGNPDFGFDNLIMASDYAVCSYGQWWNTVINRQ